MDGRTLTDEELVKGCICGRKKEWDIFIERYSRLIYHTIYKTLRVHEVASNPDDVNDLFQEVVLSLYADTCRKLRVFDPGKGCSLASWLRMITVRMTIDTLRKARSLTPVEELCVEPSAPGGQEEVAERDILDALKELLQALPAKDRLLIELSYLRELSPEEVAGILRISVGAFYTRKSRILESLKEGVKDKNIL